jgi:hypothetical protein
VPAAVAVRHATLTADCARSVLPDPATHIFQLDPPVDQSSQPALD